MQSDLELTRKVHIIAGQIHRRIPGEAKVDLEDLVQEGMVGLLEAKKRYDPQNGASFSTFAEARISGAILDGLRSLDWCSRSARHRIKHFWATTVQLTHDLGRAPTSDEAAAAAKLSLDEFFQVQKMAHLASPVSLSTPTDNFDTGATLEDAIADDRHGDGFEMVVLKEHKRLLREAFRKLNAQERQAVWLYYLDPNEYTLKEIGQFMGVGVPRVSQLCSSARKKIGVHLRKYREFAFRGPTKDECATAERAKLLQDIEGSATGAQDGRTLPHAFAF